MSDQTTDGDGDLGDFEATPEDDDSANDEEQVERKAQNTVGASEVPDDVDAAEALEEGDRVPKEVADRMDELRQEVEQRTPVEADSPLDLDPRVGSKDIAFDRAKPGAKVYVVDVLAETVEDYYEEFPDAPHLDEYAGNVVVRFTPGDAVLACVYVKDSLTSVDTNVTAYPMPESRLTRFPAESATMVGGTEVEFARTTLPEDVEDA